MNSGITYDQRSLDEAVVSSKSAIEHVDSALSSASSTNVSGVSGEVSSSFNSAVSNLQGVAESVKNIPQLYTSWNDKIVQMNVEQMAMASAMGFNYSIKKTQDGYYSVYGMGGAMTVNASCAQYLQDAINLMLSVCPGPFNNNGAKVDKPGAHGRGEAFDIYTALGLRVNYNGGGDTVYYSVNNKKTPISAYQVFYVTYDGPLEDIFNEGKLTIKKAYLKIKPGTTIPANMKKYVVSGLTNVIETDDVETSVPSLNNMRQISVEGKYLNVSELFMDHGWKQIGSYGNPGHNYGGLEWHHFQFYDKLVDPNRPAALPASTGEAPAQVVPATPLPEVAPSPEVTPTTPTPMPSTPTPTVPITPTRPSTPTPSTPTRPSTPTPSTPSPTPAPTPTNILPENKFSNSIPELKSGSLGSMEISTESVKYEVVNIKDSDYQTYLNSLSENGYTLSSDGTYWMKDNNKLYVNYLNSNLTISLSNSTYL